MNTSIKQEVLKRLINSPVYLKYKQNQTRINQEHQNNSLEPYRREQIQREIDELKAKEDMNEAINNILGEEIKEQKHRETVQRNWEAEQKRGAYRINN